MAALRGDERKERQGEGAHRDEEPDAVITDHITANSQKLFTVVIINLNNELLFFFFYTANSDAVLQLRVPGVSTRL